MQPILGLAMAVLLAMAAAVRGEEALTPAQLAAQAAAAKVLAIPDNQKAAETLTAEIREMLKDKQSVEDGVPELTIAALVKTDPQRALQIVPLMLTAAIEFIPLDLFQRLIASALIAASDAASAMIQAILQVLAGKSRWLEAAIDVSKDSALPLPIALRSAIQIIPAVVLPPVVLPPRYEGQ